NVALSELRFQAGPIHAAGDLLVTAREANDPDIALKIRALMDDWRDFPGVPAGLVERVRGGRVAGNIKCMTRLSRLADADFEGDLRVTGARLLPARPEGEPVPLREVRARFSRNAGALLLSGIVIEGDNLRGVGQLRVASTSDPNTVVAGSLEL